MMIINRDKIGQYLQPLLITIILTKTAKSYS